MEISIRLVLVAVVGLITVAIVMFLFTGKVSGFENILGSQSDAAECKLMQSRGETFSAEWIRKGCCDKLSSPPASCSTGSGGNGGDTNMCEPLSEDTCRDTPGCSWSSGSCSSTGDSAFTVN